MSDISTPTAPAAPESAPPPAEVTIPDQAPSSASGEVGQQTPSKSLEQRAMERAIERRESLERALAKAKGDAEARAETKAREKPDEAKPEARSEKPQQPTTQRPLPSRGEHGHFQSAQPAADTAQHSGQPAETPSRYAPLADNAPYREAPPRFDARAKAEWAGVPESVRGAVYQAHQQMERGIQHYKAYADAFQPLMEFHQQARQQGTNLRDVLANYSGMEQFLRRDLHGALDLLVNNLNVRDETGRKLTIYDVAAQILNRSPEQHRLIQQQNEQRALQLQMHQLAVQNAQLANHQQQIQYHQRFTATRSAIDKFAESHPRFDELSGPIKRELDHGYPLPVAYDRATKLYPSLKNGGAPNGGTHAAQTRNASAQTREGIDRSISGAPNGSAAALPRQSKPSASNREALLKAVRRVRSGV